MKELKDFYNIHKDDKIIVCGLGNSLNIFNDPEKYITIGCNDISRKFDPTFLEISLQPMVIYFSGSLNILP